MFTSKTPFESKSKVYNSRILLAVFGGLLLLISYFLYNTYHQSIDQSRHEVLSRLQSITSTASVMIDGDLHAQLSDTHMSKDEIKVSGQNPLYSRLHDILLRVKNVNHLESDVYTIVYYPKDKTFHFIGTSSAFPYYRHTYKNFPDKLLANAETGGTLDVYTDENGMWLSAFHPIKNSKGEVVALLEADERFESFIEKARNELLKNVTLSIAIVFPFAILLIGFVSSSLRKQSSAQELLFEQNEEIKSQNEEIKSQNELIEHQNSELESKVKERTIALTRSHQQLSNFLYHSSHDVQAPLATLKGVITLAEMDLTEERAKVYLNLMKDTTVRLEEMVKTLQVVHEIKSRELLIENTHIKQLVERQVTLLSDSSTGGKISIEIPEHLSHQTDSTLLERIITELLKNAIQYSNANSGKITIKAFLADHHLHLIIDDCGEGVPSSMKQNLFGLFKRGNEKSNGIGLGLFIAQTSAERLQGIIQLIHKNEPGAQFLVRLPSLSL